MKYIKTYSNTILSASGIAVLIASGTTGCQDQSQENNSQSDQKNGAFVVIEEIEKGKYKIKDEYPSDETRIVLKELNGTERILTQNEMDKLIKDESAKIENNTSNLTNPNNSTVSDGGMSLGETILASAAGAIIGSWIGSKLFGNQNYQQNRQAGYKTPSTYSRSVENFNKKTSVGDKSKNSRSGFFGSSSSSSSKSSGFFGG
jgi:hypothetical protein